MGNFTPVSPAFTVLKPLTGLLLFGQLIALTMTIYLQSNTETLQIPGNAVEAGRQIGQVEKLSKPVSPEFVFFLLEDKIEVVHNIILNFYGKILFLFLWRFDRLKSKIKYFDINDILVM